MKKKTYSEKSITYLIVFLRNKKNQSERNEVEKRDEFQIHGNNHSY